jgi:excisionase family DNA binding protein
MEKLLKIKDVAEVLGINPHSVYRLIYQREIPFVKLGRNIRFKESQISSWINKGSHDNITDRKRAVNTARG